MKYLKLSFLVIATICLIVGVMVGAPAAAIVHFHAGGGADVHHLAFIGFGGLILNRANLATMFTGYRTIFNNAFQGTPSQWEKIAMLAPSTTSQEVYPWLGQTTQFREWIGDRVIQNLGTSDFTIKNRTFENTVGVKRENIDDDTYGVYSPLIAQLGQDAKQHPDTLVFGLLKSGFSGLCYDGQNFFDTDHPVVGADGSVGSVSNSGGGSGTAWYLLDSSRVIKPIIFQKRRDYNFVRMDQDQDEQVFSRGVIRYGSDARVNVGYGLWQLAYGSKQELTADNYATARAAMASFKGDNGKPLGINPDLLVVPPTLEGDALEILINERNADGSTNKWRNSAKLLMTPWLA